MSKFNNLQIMAQIKSMNLISRKCYTWITWPWKISKQLRAAAAAPAARASASGRKGAKMEHDFAKGFRGFSRFSLSSVQTVKNHPNQRSLGSICGQFEQKSKDMTSQEGTSIIQKPGRKTRIWRAVENFCGAVVEKKLC